MSLQNHILQTSSQSNNKRTLDQPSTSSSKVCKSTFILMATPSNPYKKPSKPTKTYQSPSLQSTSASSHTSPPSPLPPRRITRSQYKRFNPLHLGDSTTHKPIMQDIKDAINDKESKSPSVRKFSGPSNLSYKSKKQKREAKQTKITSFLNKADKEYLDKRISFLEDHLRRDPTTSQTTLKSPPNSQPNSPLDTTYIQHLSI